MNYKDKIINSQKELKLLSQTSEEIIVKARYGPSTETRIPLELTEKLSFFLALIIGDGHLKKDKLQIIFECTNKTIMKEFQKICKELFKRKFNIHPRKPRKNQLNSYSLYIDSKAIYNLLNKAFEIPSGKKSNIVKIPIQNKKSNKSIKSSFLIGIMITEGGRRKRELGLSTSSKQLWQDLINLFGSLNIKVFIDKWIYKKYNKEYYGIVFKRKDLLQLVENSKDKKIKQILRCRDFN